MNDASRRIRAALREHLVPRVRALGFKGGLAGLRRKGDRGVDVLVIPLFKGVVQLDAGWVRRRSELGARTVREDWAVYASPRSGRDDRAARRRLEDASGKGVFRYDLLTSDRAAARLAVALAEIVETDGARFWGTAGPVARAAAKARAPRARPSVGTSTLAAEVTSLLRAQGFVGGMKGTSGAFRREAGAEVALVSLGVGDGELLVQVAKRAAGRRKGAKTPELDFIHAPERDDLLTRSLARGNATAHARAVARAVAKRFPRR